MLRLSTHSQRLENWLGAEAVEEMSRLMRDWPGPDIALGGAPGAVYARKGGDFVGHIAAGSEANILDKADDVLRRMRNALRIKARSPARSQLSSGFASLTALRNAQTRATRRTYPFYYPSPGAGSAGPGRVISYWTRQIAGFTVIPPINGTNGSASPAGRVPVGGTDGGFKFQNAPTGMTQHIVGGACSTTFTNVSPVTGAALLHDRLFDVLKTSMNVITADAVTGVPTRYQSTTRGNAADCAGNFCFPEIQNSVLTGGVSWQGCTYNNQAGAGATFPTVAMGTNQNSTNLALPNYGWFMPMAAGDFGVQSVTNMQNDVASATGVVNFVVAHPIAWFPFPLSVALNEIGGIASAFNLARIFDDACLQYLFVRRIAGQTDDWGYFETACG